MTTLRELADAAARLSEDEFPERYPHPALVVLAVTQAAEQRQAEALAAMSPEQVAAAEARYAKTGAFTADDLDAPATAPGRSAPAGDGDGELGPRCQVVFLEKSDRNPFAAMITVGRARNNDVCFGLATVSTMHAYFMRKPSGEWSVTDQRSTNGTRVDGVALPAGGSAPVSDGTRVAFGPDMAARFYTPDGLYGMLALCRTGALR